MNDERLNWELMHKQKKSGNTATIWWCIADTTHPESLEVGTRQPVG